MNLFESLEQRSLLSISLANGTLSLVGNAKNNSLQVFYSPQVRKLIVSEATVGQAGVVKQFNPGQVRKIRIIGGGGNDLVTIASTGKVPIFFDGGTGADTFAIGATTGRHTLLGGAGDDILNGDKAADSIDGGAGNDRINGQDGNDTLIGGAGIDLLDAGGGNDLILARDGKRDTVDGGDGTDRARVDLLAGVPNEASFDAETLI